MRIAISTAILMIVFACLPELPACQAQDCPCGPASMAPHLRARLVPQEFCGADFRPACRAHDRCYEAGCLCQKDCDDRFLADLCAACSCSANPRRCQRIARSMYRSVRLFGRRAYLNGH